MNAEEIILENSIPTTTLEIDYSSHENNDETQPLSSQDHTEQNVQDAAEYPQEAFTPIEGLKIGQWVEFVGEGEQHRLNCKLAHIDKHTNRYTFENRSGMKVAECDGKQLSGGIKSGSIIIQNDVQIFDRALQAGFEKFKKL